MTKPTLLEISPPDAGLTLQLYTSNDAPSPSMGSPATTATIASLLEKQAQALAEGTREALMDFGRDLAAVAGPDLAGGLWSGRQPLILKGEGEGLLWECMLEDGGTSQLSAHRPVIRPISELNQRTPTTPPEHERKCLLIGDPLGAMPGAADEVREAHQVLRPHADEVRVLLGERARVRVVEDEIDCGEQFLLMHLATPVAVDPNTGQPYLVLAQRGRLPLTALAPVMKHEPLVFLDVYVDVPAKLDAARPPVPGPVLLALCRQLAAAGAGQVIAVAAGARDNVMPALIRDFYSFVAEGMSPAEAVRQITWREGRGLTEQPLTVITYDTAENYETLDEATPFDGEMIRLTAFNPPVDAALEAAAGMVETVDGNAAIGPLHVFRALLQTPASLTQKSVRQLGVPFDRLHGAIARRIFGTAIPRPPYLKRSAMTPALSHVLQAAAMIAAGNHEVRIGEDAFLLGLLQAADDETLNILREAGLDLERLLRLLKPDLAPPGGDRDGTTVVSAPPSSPSPGGSEPELSFGESAALVLQYALADAFRAGYSAIETPHLVIGLTKVADGATARGLQAQGFDPKRVRDTIRVAMPPVAPPKRPPDRLRPELLSPRCRQIIDLAANAARALGSSTIEEPHLLIGFVEVPGSGTAAFLEQRLGIKLDELAAVARGSTKTGAQAGQGTPLLDKLGRDLTQLAHEGKLKPVIGRRKEISRIAQVLARSDKNTPLLIGDAGVGKTAIVEGLAQRIANGEAPGHLKDARIIELPIAGLVAGTKYRGDLEERLTQVLLEARNPNIILFLDEIHTLVGAGRSEGGLMDLGNMIKASLARGEIRCIGATTVTEFRKSIEKDEALERRFQPIMVNEPSAEEALEILRQLRPRYESHHTVHIADEALEAAVRLSITYLPDRRLPDKACDLIDEACSRARVGSVTTWVKPAQPKPGDVTIDADAIAGVVAEWTGIPVARLAEGEQQKLLRLETLLQQRVIGQEEAISALAEAVRQARAGLKRPNRPVGVFFFIGPSGVGKTELAKALAEVLFGSEDDLLRLDMSEYEEPHSVSKLIGSPPGYVGYEEDGQLTGALRRKPYTVVLLDEIDKAHPRVLDIFLQLFDDGRLTDAQGRQADGKNAVFIATSNVPVEVMQKKAALGFQHQVAVDDDRQKVMAQLGKQYRPEFLNRLDEVILFRPLTREQVASIAKLQVGRLVKQVQGQYAVTLEVTEEAIAFLAAEGYSEQYGARPLDRAISRLIAKPLSSLILKNVRGTILAQVKDGQIEVAAA